MNQRHPRRHNRSSLTPRRKQLRNNPTPAEKILWQYIKNSQLEGRKFRRQHSYDVYYMDFYCTSERLCIELDGQSHDTPEAKLHDARKDEYLSSHFIKVLRLRNEEVYNNIGRVLEKIRQVWSSRKKH